MIMYKAPNFFHISDNLIINKSGYLITLFKVNLSEENYINSSDKLELRDFYKQIVAKLNKYFLFIYSDKKQLQIQGAEIFVFDNHFAIMKKIDLSLYKSFMRSIYSDDIYFDTNVYDDIAVFNQDINMIFSIAQSYGIFITNLVLRDNQHSEAISFLIKVLFREDHKVHNSYDLQNYAFNINNYIETQIGQQKKYHTILVIKNRGFLNTVFSANMLLSSIDVIITEICYGLEKKVKDDLLYSDIYTDNDQQYLNTLLVHITSNTEESLKSDIAEISLILSNLSFVIEGFLAQDAFIAQISVLSYILNRGCVSNDIFLVSNILNYSYGPYNSKLFTAPVAIFNQIYGKSYFFNISEVSQHSLFMTSDNSNKLLSMIVNNISENFSNNILILNFYPNKDITKTDDKFEIIDKTVKDILIDLINLSVDQTIAEASKVQSDVISYISSLKFFNFSQFLEMISQYDIGDRKVFLLLNIVLNYFKDFPYTSISSYMNINFNMFDRQAFFTAVVKNYGNMFFYIDKILILYDKLCFLIFYSYVELSLRNNKSILHIVIYGFEFLLNGLISNYVKSLAQNNKILFWISINTLYVEYSKFETVMSYFNKFIYFSFLYDLELNIDKKLDKDFDKLRNYDHTFFLLSFNKSRLILSLEGLR